jgi:hypothetical protein
LVFENQPEVYGDRHEDSDVAGDMNGDSLVGDEHEPQPGDWYDEEENVERTLGPMGASVRSPVDSVLAHGGTRLVGASTAAPLTA